MFDRKAELPKGTCTDLEGAGNGPPRKFNFLEFTYSDNNTPTPTPQQT